MALLTPLKEVTMELRKSTANSQTIIDVVLYLKHLATTDIVSNVAIAHVLEKHVNGNPIISALLNNCGPFYNFVRTKIQRNAAASASVLTSAIREQCESDHSAYSVLLVAKPVSFSSFTALERQRQDVIVTDVLKNLKPSSVDAERLFSYGRIAKNYLQSRMSPEIHNRNVFLNKNSK